MKSNVIDDLSLEMMQLTTTEEKEIIEKISFLDDVDKRGERDGRTLLIHSAFYNCRQIAEYLIKNGATIDLKDKQGFTSLHAAVSSGNVEMVELLLSEGASVNEKDAYGNTPLHGTSPQNPHIIKLLLAAGADCYDENNYGVSTYQIFLAYPDIINLFEDYSGTSSYQSGGKTGKTGDGSMSRSR